MDKVTSGSTKKEALNRKASPTRGGRHFLEAEAVIRQLEDELDRAKEQLHTMTEEHKASKEQMTASNEELQLVTEELRSTAEELETSMEELQSVNEELRALNEELKIKIEEINGISSDLQNLMNVTEIGTIFLDRHLCIKRYTLRVEDLFHITGADVGRPLAHLTHKLGNASLPGDAAQVLRELEVIERELQHTENQQWFLVRLRAYHTVTGSIEGVVIAFVDITERKKHEEQLETLIETLEVMVAARADNVKQLASELILSKQAERQRIAQILHDDLQQQLYALQMRMAALSGNLSQEQAARLTQANTLIADAIECTQTLTVDLSPPVLQGQDFTVALDWLTIQMEDMHGLQVAIEASGPVRLPSDMRTLLYQLVRELLFNVVKHAGIDRARVKLLLGEDRLILVVADEGAGFDLAAVQARGPAKPGGFGLHSVRQRLDFFGGCLDIATAPGQGTRVTLFVPLGNGPPAPPPGDDDKRPGPDR